MTEADAPVVLDLPVGIEATGLRPEFDSVGHIDVPADRYWGAQTQRSLEHFSIGNDRMPIELYRAYGHVKKVAAIANAEIGPLPAWKAKLIAQVCDEVTAGAFDSEFPLYVWQTGSGTQSNMNVNEVISNRCIQLVGGELGSQTPVHPNDDVNMSQSSNDTFPTAMHIAGYEMVSGRTLPALRALRQSLDDKASAWSDVVKVGRTHLQDATPLTVGQEWSGYVGALDDAIADLEHAVEGLLVVAMGGTAVGTGVNAPPGFAQRVATELATQTGYAIEAAPNPFTAQSTSDRMVRAHSALKGVAVSLFKIANDLRWLGSGPRSGLMELKLPANEPGSSIMPGKVNPTQAEAMLMVCMQVMASDAAIAMAGAEGNFELHAFRPIIIDNFLRSGRNLADMTNNFRKYLVEGTELNESRLRLDVERSVMMVTALSPIIGYEAAARIAHHAMEHDLPLREAAQIHGVSDDVFNQHVDPVAFTRSDVGHRQGD